MSDKPRVVVGIDPGKKGFIAVVQDDPRAVVLCFPCPIVPGRKTKTDHDASGMTRVIKYEILREYDIRLVVIERQQTFPKEGVTSAFTTGRGYGLWEGIISALELPYECPHPKTWGKDVLRDIGGERKQQSIIAAGRLYPGIDLRRTEHPNSKPCHDKAEAILMAHWGWGRLTGHQPNTEDGKN